MQLSALTDTACGWLLNISQLTCISTAAGLIVVKRPLNTSLRLSCTANELPSCTTICSNIDRLTSVPNICCCQFPIAIATNRFIMSRNSGLLSWLWNGLYCTSLKVNPVKYRCKSLMLSTDLSPSAVSNDITNSNGFTTRCRQQNPLLFPISLILNSFRTFVIFASSVLFLCMFSNLFQKVFLAINI